MQDIIFTVWINEHFDYQLDVVHWAVLFHFLFFLFFLHLLIIFWQIQNLCEIVIQMESEICILEVKIAETSILDKFYWYVSIPVFVQMITNAWGQNLCSEGKINWERGSIQIWILNYHSMTCTVIQMTMWISSPISCINLMLMQHKLHCT